MDAITIFTIGFAKKRAAEFFSLLQEAGVRRVLDIRLNNVSQLAGFTKQPDLAFFLRRILGVECVPLPQLAPSKEILRAYQKKCIDWPQYERQFNDLLAGRRVEESVPPALLDRGCLLCSEPKPDRCHRRLAAEYFRSKWRDVDIVHL